MPLTNGTMLVNHASENNYAVAAINANGADYEIIRALIEVIEEEKSPLIIGSYEANLVDYRGYDYAGYMMNYFAKNSSAPVAIHLDHGSSVDACQKAIDAGFNSVMIDGSKMPIDENIALVKEVCAIAKPKGVTVEAEVGELQKLGADGQMGEAKNLASVDEVKRISNETDIDILAVGIGNAHGFYKGKPDIRTDLLAELKEASAVPLVLHGTTGLEDDVVKECISIGIAKINLGTLIRSNRVKYTAEAIETVEHNGHAWRVARAVKDSLKDDIRQFISLIGSAGKAEGIS